jgi:hypothetical protein
VRTVAEFEKGVDSLHAGEVEKLSTEDLAALVVDALLRAGIVKAEDVKRAIAIAIEEIDVRKTLGDY